MNYSAIKYFSTVNGDGIFTSVFVSGCDLRCKGCFNAKAWDSKVGKELTEEKINEVLESIDKPYINGLSILGGEPLANFNLEGVKNLINRFRERFGDGKEIWLWSGYYLSELNQSQKDIVNNCDYFIDGRFEEDKFDMDLKFRGSSNQTIWKNNKGTFEKSELN